ncbi:DNA-3-methyladenine glycosylase I [Facklamia miroungae]|uniref:DNA-3-methyladenine glycosylase I n=1 Tax=Facklamia miroungae TaxID=120956 RepID=A0A1G7SM96_9LACT|nr:DNA-3-methyladenine glycosylase I [Facklamia miroungae]NKZ29605.1 DNA-3-methyladenine glycosylase I [Facklamia miroungae]SDG24061.1 DNA-3-methyladenine glycosylase I [Facklamia miroungae]
MKRCQWVTNKPDYYLRYHDEIWGKPEHDDLQLFKWLILESFHVGLSWQLVLSKEHAFELAFDQFDYCKIAHYQENKIEALLDDSKIIRHRGKIEATVTNAQAFLKIQEDYGSFDRFIWHFTEGEVILKPKNQEASDTSTELSDRVAKALKEYGFKYVGSVTIYSYLQAIGVVNDHDYDCSFR